MKIKKGDNIIVLSGKDRGKKGKVLRSFPGQGLVVVEKVNLKKIHKRPRRQGEKGQVVEVAAAFDVCKVKLVCSKCNKPSRVGYKLEGGQKARVCKKCREEI
jgi:large subunit ribosomal protein L24